MFFVDEINWSSLSAIQSRKCILGWKSSIWGGWWPITWSTDCCCNYPGSLYFQEIHLKSVLFHYWGNLGWSDAFVFILPLAPQFRPDISTQSFANISSHNYLFSSLFPEIYLIPQNSFSCTFLDFLWNQTISRNMFFDAWISVTFFSQPHTSHVGQKPINS